MSIVVRQLSGLRHLLYILAVPVLIALLALLTQSGFAQSAATQTGGAESAGTTQAPLCDPTWEVVPNLNTPRNHLNSVAVVSASDAWAVGHLHGDTYLDPIATLIEHWDGSSWSVISSLSPGAGYNTLKGVAVVSANDVWAVGSYGAGNFAEHSLIEHWDGGSWSVVASPGDYLNGVSVLSANDVWAVGGDMGGIRLILHWDGTQWNIITMHNSAGSLLGVDANAADDIWAVGTGGGRTLTYHWDGAVWTEWAPSGQGDLNELQGIASVSADDVWAVGWSRIAPISGEVHTLIKHWDGSTWSVVSSPNPGTYQNSLMGIAVVSSEDIWAVGSYSSSVSDKQTLIEHWDGSTWSVVSSSNPGTYQNSLMGIAVVSSEDIWAVGTYQLDGDGDYAEYPLVERYTICVPTPTPTPEPSPTPVPCIPGVFNDVPADNAFYPFVTCLVNRGIISGYTDCTFRPNNQVTRGQLAKIVSNAAGFQEDPGPQIFEDVPPDSTFYQWVNRLSSRGFMSGYNCGGVGEPCLLGNLPYFRPGANATRGQTSKIVSNSAGYIEEPSGQTFNDVSTTHPFYKEIQRLATRSIMGGYPCGGVGEPCDSDSRPYFRPQNNVTRGQASKIVANTFYPDCQTFLRK